MMKKKFIDFMTSEESSGEVEGIFTEFKKLFYEGKSGYNHALVLTNTSNGRKWVSSTNHLKDRRKTLEGGLKEKDRKSWHEPWLITFGNLGDDIIDKVNIQEFEDIGKIPTKEFIDMSIPQGQIDNIKDKFIKLAAKYIAELNLSNGIEIRKLIDEHFKSDQKNLPLRTIINSIDDYVK